MPSDPTMYTDGYFIVRRLPMLPSIHSMWPSVFDPGALGHEVVDVRRPVLDRRVGDACARADDDLDDGRVQRVARVHGRRAALDVVHLRALVGDDQRALELPGVLTVDAEVGLQRHLALDARRHVDERATRPHRGVERRELVVARRDDRAEVALDDIGVLAHRSVHVTEQDALAPRARRGCGGRRLRSRTER